MRKGSKQTEEAKEKARQATLMRYQSGEVFGFQKEHPFHTKNLHKFTVADRQKGILATKARTPWNKGKKLDFQTGEKHWNWKGGYERKLYNNRKRFNQKRNAEGSHTLEEWETLKQQYRYTCLCCKRQEPEIVLTVDHIVPITKGGTDDIENIQPLCQGCNSRKYNNIISYIPIAA